MSKVYQQLSAAFPEEALSVDSSRGFDLTSVKAQYIIERLNEVLGINGWNHIGTYQDVDKGVLFFGEMTIVVDGVPITKPSVGYSDDKKNLGDAYKGARTDSLSKAASLFGVANDVFKGKVSPPKKGQPAPKYEKPAPQAAQIKQLTQQHPSQPAKPSRFAGLPGLTQKGNT